MIVNELDNKVRKPVYSKVITIEDDDDSCTVVFPDTKNFITNADYKRNAEKLYNILKRPTMESS